jgi:hypothetical protein
VERAEYRIGSSKDTAASMVVVGVRKRRGRCDPERDVAVVMAAAIMRQAGDVEWAAGGQHGHGTRRVTGVRSRARK